ncbi:MAG: phosphoribosylglycinamide formyltransferase [Oxalicibacterium faecigallinarum]|uniref:phosphoribosylglycinamide formyltransferase n=1 Tax=Oxalicibacterium faecigallinarum TaxID=573741 RepID=UPI002808A052|nr:phosphoribosylglycinamide formyltransferase [Oxalicibacterium faecigallinarum]MDQ7968781.1 phosphoribosylglycinamide formyltransferase [Oxalicibacterium faecigallinarum]
MKKIVILISGRGSNMQAILRTAQDEQWPVEIAAVISNRADAPGLIFAAQQGVPTIVIPSDAYPDRAAFDAALQAAIDAHTPDLVVLAGFMRILTDAFVQHYQGRMLNIHPSLLPSFVGLATHRQALKAGVRIHGATVHFVTPQLDHGPIVAQVAVPVLPDDTEQTLAARVLEHEHQIYPQAVRWFIEDRLTIVDGIVRIAEGGVA